jgi:hypothetical protein
MRARINDAELVMETFGEPTDPAVLLIMGAAASMDRWETLRHPLRQPRHGRLDDVPAG